MKKKWMILIVAIVVSGWIVFDTNKPAASLGIIGGSDGPTVVFVSSTLKNELMVGGILLLAILLYVLAYKWIKRA